MKFSEDYDGSKYLVSNWIHRAWVSGGCTTLLITLAKSISLAPSSNYSLLHFIFAAFIAYLFADLTSGFYHWGCDNYGSPKFPILGFQFEAFLYHHHRPSDIAKVPISAHHYFAASLVIFTVMPINLLVDDPLVLAFMFVLAGFNMFGFQIHAWAHTSRRDMPRVVAVLQDAGVFISQISHAPHHRPPHNCNYCSMSGWWNRFLNWSGFFVKLEKLIFQVSGVRARSWDSNQG